MFVELMCDAVTTSVARKILDALGAVVRHGAVALMFAGGVLLCARSLPRAGAPYTAILLTVILVAAAVWLHEAGHWIAARLAGMRVLRVCGTFIEIVLQRRGFRARWWRSPQVWGVVFAVPAPDRAMRPALLAFIAGGPVASLLVASTSVTFAWAFPAASAAGVLWAMALINALMAVLALVPQSGAYRSDGDQLLYWGRLRDERSAKFAPLRLLSLTVHGTTPDALPAEDLAELESQPSPASLQALWHRIKAAQNRGDWDATPALTEAVDAQTKALASARNRQTLGDMLRCELAFSESMRLRDDAPLRVCTPTPELAFLDPALASRFDALRAVLRGDAAACEAALAEARRRAENELDAASSLNEARIAAALRERFGLQPAAGTVLPIERSRADITLSAAPSALHDTAPRP